MELVLIPAAFLAGVLMFLAPCTLPIVPGYLAFIAGVAPGEEKNARGRVLRNALWFVLGFSFIFVLLGTFASLIGAAALPWRGLVSQVGGVVIVLFGLTMLGLFRLPFLSSERHLSIPKFLTIGRPESSALIGMLFALGWSPCIGPILGTILFVASSTNPISGATLLSIFSLGLGLPFLLSAFFIDKLGTTFVRWGRLTQILSYIGGLVLVGIGLLMIFGSMGLLVSWGFSFFESTGYHHLLEYL